MLPLWNFFIRKRQFTKLLLITIILWGGASALYITKESSPEVQIPIGIVSVVLPGASSSDVERLVTNKIEEGLANIADLDTITSSSRDGLSVVTVQFLASADLDKSIAKLKDEVDKIQPDLPEDATDPSVTDVNFADQPIQIISITADLPFAELARLGEELKSDLQGIAGVSRIEVSGVQNRQIQVVVKKEELARYNLSLMQVAQAISSANASLPAGSITVDSVLYNISFEGSLDDVTDIGSIPVITQAAPVFNGIPSGQNGQVIYLRDIATVSDGVEKATSYSRISVDGVPSEQALTLTVFKVRGQDVGKTTKAVNERLDELKATTLSGSQVLVTNDLGDQVSKDLKQLTRTGVETVILVMLCLLLTIGWREALIAGLSIPLSFMVAFVALYYTGNTLNFISLFSLILAIGILVDSGIVMVEAIHTRTHVHHNKTKAAFEALREYAWPLIAGTMTTVVMFIPLFFISGIVGEFIATIPYTIIFVLIASIFVALGLVPTLAVMFTKEGNSEMVHAQEEYAQKARDWYSRFLTRVLGSRRWQNYFMLSMALGFIAAIALPVSGILKVSFFPQDDIDWLYVDVEMPSGTPLAQTDLTVRAVEEKLYSNPEIESLVTSVGGTSSFGTNPQSGERYGSVTITLREDREHTSTEIVEGIKKDIADINSGIVRAGQPSGGPPVGAAIDLKFLGTDGETLDRAVTEAEEILKSVPGATEVETSNKDDSTEFILTVDRDKLAQTGITPLQAAGTLRTAIAGSKATTLTGGSRDVDIMVALNLNSTFTDPHQATVTTLDAIRQIPLTSPSGQTVLLGSVVTERLDRSNASINHEDRLRVVRLTANVAPGLTAGEVLANFQAKMVGVTLPEGVTMKVGGENEETNQSFAEMGIAFLAGLGLMFVILVLTFNSMRYSLYLLLAVILSIIGVFGGLTLTGQTLSFSSLLGIIALAGVIINHAIILMDSILHRLKLEHGREFKEIVVDSAVTRLRPIFLTTITTVVGMIPLTYVSTLWGPLAFAILFGLSFAMLLTLILIPLLVYRWPGNITHLVEKDEGLE